MSRRALIHQLFVSHARSLQAFFRGRWQARQDAADLTQEVYLRLLRAQEREIHNPEAYLFTIANNLLKERFVMRNQQRERVDLAHPQVLDTLHAEARLVEAERMAGIEREVHVSGLRIVVPELSARCQLVLLMAFEEELSHQEMANRLGISKTMVRKLLAQAIRHCRRRLLEMETV